MLEELFRKHGEFCAAHPLEVVVTAITIITSLLSMGTSVHYEHDRVCGWNYDCAKAQNLKKSDVVLLSIARCVALVYIYMQFRSLRRVGSKHLLGISGVFTIFSSFMFCIAFVKMYGSNTMSGLYEVLPFFLFLIDLSKASALAVFALSATNRAEIQLNVGKGMKLLGPAISLDAVVETLAIGLGTISGVQQLETMCKFGCLSIVVNYVAFMTFYPSCLALVLELSLNRDQSDRELVIYYKHLAEEMGIEKEMKKPNPVIQRVKIIMSIGLAIVHIHSRICTHKLVASPASVLENDRELMEPEMSIWQFYLYRMFAVHVDYGLTLILGIVLLIKYVSVDRHIDILGMKNTMQLQQRDAATVGTQTEEDEADCSNLHLTSFTLGDYGDSEDYSVELESRLTQTDLLQGLSPLKQLISETEARPLDECVSILESDCAPAELTDIEIKALVNSKHIPSYKLETMLDDHERGVSIRRQLTAEQVKMTDSLDNIPFSNYNYVSVYGACCENVIGYMPIPVGVAGPLLLDGNKYMVPMATTEGCLVASTNRGCAALRQCTGVRSMVVGDGMTRGPALRFPNIFEASQVKLWIEKPENFEKLKEVFDGSSRFARLQRLQSSQAGRLLYVRFVATTGDAMGMNMVSKGTEIALKFLLEHFPDMEILSLSGNYCTDKKPSAINWIEGRGKYVVCEAVVTKNVVEQMLKTTVAKLVDLNCSKNLVGSAMAGTIGGYNAHAANIVTAIFIATGQDPAQVAVSSNCITLIEAMGVDNEDLYITCTMPSLEVGTVGGGTVLKPQEACLKMLGVCGSSTTAPGENASQLARIICATVLAGELSLLSALAAGQLVKSHLLHNRSSMSVASFQNNDRLDVVMPKCTAIETAAKHKSILPENLADCDVNNVQECAVQRNYQSLRSSDAVKVKFLDCSHGATKKAPRMIKKSRTLDSAGIMYHNAFV